MNAKKQLIRRYLLAAAVGFVVGLVGIAVTYQRWCNRNGFDEGFVKQQINIRSQYKQEFRSSASELVSRALLLYFLINYNSAVNILISSTLLMPFAVYTFDVFAASRRKRGQGVA